MEIHTLIVNDEPLARERIEGLLAAYPFIKVRRRCANGKEALKVLQHTEVDLMFLDIQMPEMNGLELLRRLPIGRLPLIVFVTAFDQYAIEAFDHFAVDYLLKPYSNDRFQQTIDRILQRFTSGSSTQWKTLLIRLIQYFQEPTEGPLADKLKIELAGKIYFVAIDSIEYICSDGNYLQIKAEAKKHLIRQTITELDQRLPAPQFVRIHRSIIINLQFLKEVFRTSYSDLEVKMKDGSIFRVSRTYRENFSQKIQLK